MARAVIEFTQDISPALPVLKDKIAGTSYAYESGSAALNYQGMAVVIKPHQIIIYKAENEMVAYKMIEWLKRVLFE